MKLYSQKNSVYLFIVSTLKEARWALDFKTNYRKIFLCTYLEAEFFLERKIPGYKNPLYDFYKKDSSLDAYKYLRLNFNESYKWCRPPYLIYIRDRFGYFLTELNRSLDVASAIVETLRPSKIFIGELIDLPGSSVLNANLKNDAFWLVSRSRAIPVGRIPFGSEKKFEAKAIIGKIIKKLRFFLRQKLPGKTDVLIVATPSHLIKLQGLLSSLKKKYLLTVLTYDVTWELKSKLDNLGIKYFEKERLADINYTDYSRKIIGKLQDKRIWNEFKYSKYKNWRFVSQYISEKIRRIINVEMTPIVEDLCLARNITANARPKVLLTTTDPDTKILPYIICAKGLGAITVALQHGIFFKSDPPSCKPVSDHFITWSTLSKNTLLENKNFRDVNITIGKYPFYSKKKDIYYINKNFAKRRIINKKKRVLFLSAIDIVDSSLKNYFLRKFFDAIDSLGDILELTVRPHPHQNIRNLTALADRSRVKVDIQKAGDLNSAIRKADIVIFENTTAGFNAMLAKKPTVYFNPYSGEDFFKIGNTQASLLVLNVFDINTKLKQFLINNDDWKYFAGAGYKFAVKYLGLNSRSSHKLEEIFEKYLK